MQTLLQDIRYSIRVLLKNPGFTIVAILTLAVGIGANSIIFCVAKSLMFPPLPFRDAGGILRLTQAHRESGGFASSIPDFLDWKAQNHVFSQMAAVSYGWSTISGGIEPEEVDTAFVSEDFFDLLGVGPQAGRLFFPEEYRPGGERVMILGNAFWQRQFGGRTDALGRQLTLSGESYTIVGIMPPGFESQFSTKAFLPLSARRDAIPTDRTNRRSGVFARLKPGVTLDQARREMAVIADHLAKAYPASNTDVTVLVESWRERLFSRFRTMTSLLLGAVGFVLLIGCANVANLLMARAASRQKEIAVRLAMGAGRLRLIRQLLTESLVLAALGGIIGILLAFWSVPLLNNFYVFAGPYKMDFSILALTTTLVGFTALLFGSIPAFLLSRLGLCEVLKDKTTRAGSMRSHHFRNILVIGEMALSLVLLYGSALLIQSFLRFESVDKGFNPRNVLYVVVNAYKDRYPRGSQVVELGRDILAQFEHLPGRESEAVATPIALKSGPGNWGITAAGRQADAAGSAPMIDILAVSSDYFRVMEIPLLRGRPFTQQEAEQGARAVIISEKLARRFWPGDDPVGKTLKLDTVQFDMPWLSVLGVAREARGHSFPSAGVEALGLYIPYGLMRVGGGDFARVGGNRDGRFTSLRFYIRTKGDPKGRAGPARTAVSAVDKQQPVFSVRTMEEKLSLEGSPRRAMAIMVGVFAFVALLLAAVGTYGVMAYSVSERTPEIGIRMALGAQRMDALALVLRHGIRLLLIGLPLGLGGAVALSGILESQLFGVSAGDPITLVGVSLTLAGVAISACYLPARRAAKVNPMVALRYE
jgi:putative ABC transport system permease protein